MAKVGFRLIAGTPKQNREFGFDTIDSDGKLF